VAKTQYFCAATLRRATSPTNDDRIDWLQGFESGYDGPGEKVLDAIDSYNRRHRRPGDGLLDISSSSSATNWPYVDRPTWC